MSNPKKSLTKRLTHFLKIDDDEKEEKKEKEHKEEGGASERKPKKLTMAIPGPSPVEAPLSPTTIEMLSPRERDKVKRHQTSVSRTMTYKVPKANEAPPEEELVSQFERFLVRPSVPFIEFSHFLLLFCIVYPISLGFECIFD